jgi:hypothetical protein
LPEAQEQIEKYYEENDDDGAHFPFIFLTVILSFTLILWIEKIATDAHSHDHHRDSHEKVHSQSIQPR